MIAAPGGDGGGWGKERCVSASAPVSDLRSAGKVRDNATGRNACSMEILFLIFWMFSGRFQRLQVGATGLGSERAPQSVRIFVWKKGECACCDVIYVQVKAGRALT